MAFKNFDDTWKIITSPIFKDYLKLVIFWLFVVSDKKMFTLFEMGQEARSLNDVYSWWGNRGRRGRKGVNP
jgi:hypothetical protein